MFKSWFFMAIILVTFAKASAFANALGRATNGPVCATILGLNLLSLESPELTSPVAVARFDRGLSNLIVRNKSAPNSPRIDLRLMPDFDLLMYRSGVRSRPGKVGTAVLLSTSEYYRNFVGGQRRPYILTPGWSRILTNSEAKSQIDTAFRYLYGSYEMQDSERRDNIELYRNEDSQTAARTMHFLQTIHGKLSAHIQAQGSEDPAVKLNFETHFNVSKRIRRKLGERVFEIGRFEILKPVPGSEFLGDRQTRDLLMLRSIQKVSTWLLGKAEASRAFFQVNDRVLEILGEAVAPVTFEKKYRVKSSPNAKPEWVVELDRPSLEKIETVTTKKLMLFSLNKALAQVQHLRQAGDDSPDIDWSWFVWPDELRAFKSSGLVDFWAEKMAEDFAERYKHQHPNSEFRQEVIKSHKNKLLQMISEREAPGMGLKWEWALEFRQELEKSLTPQGSHEGE